MDMKIETLNIRGSPPNSNLTGLMRAYAIRIESMDIKPGTQAFRGDLSGLFLISARAYTIRIESMDMKIETLNIRGTPPISNLTGLIRAYAIRSDSMDMKPGTQDFRGDLSGLC